jgi:hypothetical protein
MFLRVVLITLLGGFLPTTTFSADVGSAARADFEWFSKLGFPDVKGCPFIRVATGQWSQAGDGSRQNNYLDAFLIGTNNNTFSIFSLDLLTRAFTNTPPGTAEYQRAGFERADLRQQVRTTLASLLASPPREDYFWRFRFDSQVTERARAFILAWACWRQGFEEEAQDLYYEAQKITQRAKIDHSDFVFRIALEKDFADALMRRALDDFGNPSITRPELLGKFESILTSYPHSEHCERARGTAIALKRMIAEDKQHAETLPRDFSQLTTEEKVRELIFRLRDQNGHQMTYPGSCDIFEDWRSTNTPAHQLVRMGYTAVPQLIAALDSDAFSRSVSESDRQGYLNSVLTVGACAEQILRRITGKSFSSAEWFSGRPSKNGRISATRQAAEAWWAGVQKKGEQQMLIDAIVSPGDYDAPAEARLLRQRFPDVAAAALIKGIRAATNASVCAGFIRELATLDQETGTEFLKEELERGPFLESRAAAAFGLRHRAKDLAIDAMIREWQKLPNEISNEDSQWELVAEFLGTCDSARGVTALADGLQKRSPEVKFKVVDVLSDRNNWCFYYTNLPPSTETVDAMEKCLVSELDDTDERFGYSGGINDTTFCAPRICDMVAWHLAKRWPARYTFDISASLKSRDRQCLDAMNIWRTGHGLTALPIPLERATHVSPEEATKVTLIEWSPDTIPPNAAFAARISAFKGNALDADDLAHLLWEFVNRPETNARGLQLKAIKDEDLTGVRLSVKLFHDKSPGTIRYWKQCDKISLQRNVLANSNMAGIPSSYSQPDSSFRDKAKLAIAGEPEAPFEISVRLETKNSP